MNLLYDYLGTGRLDMLNRAIASFGAAVAITPKNRPDRPEQLYDLGRALRSRYERLGKLADLEEAIAAACQALAGQAL